MKTIKQAIGNVFTQSLVKSLDLKQEHKPYIVIMHFPEFKDTLKDGKYDIELSKPIVELKHSVITERFITLWQKDNRYRLVINQ